MVSSTVDDSEEILNAIDDLLKELNKNYYDLLRMVDELEDSSVEIDEDYKRIIDAIKGIRKY